MTDPDATTVPADLVVERPVVRARTSAVNACSADTQCNVPLTFRPSGESPPRVAGS